MRIIILLLISIPSFAFCWSEQVDSDVNAKTQRFYLYTSQCANISEEAKNSLIIKSKIIKCKDDPAIVSALFHAIRQNRSIDIYYDNDQSILIYKLVSNLVID